MSRRRGNAGAARRRVETEDSYRALVLEILTRAYPAPVGTARLMEPTSHRAPARVVELRKAGVTVRLVEAEVFEDVVEVFERLAAMTAQANGVHRRTGTAWSPRCSSSVPRQA